MGQASSIHNLSTSRLLLIGASTAVVLGALIYLGIRAAAGSGPPPAPSPAPPPPPCPETGPLSIKDYSSKTDATLPKFGDLINILSKDDQCEHACFVQGLLLRQYNGKQNTMTTSDITSRNQSMCDLDSIDPIQLDDDHSLNFLEYFFRNNNDVPWNFSSMPDMMVPRTKDGTPMNTVITVTSDGVQRYLFWYIPSNYDLEFPSQKGQQPFGCGKYTNLEYTMTRLTNTGLQPVRGLLLTCSSDAQPAVRPVSPVVTPSVLGKRIVTAVLLVQCPQVLTGFGMNLGGYTIDGDYTIKGLQKQEAENLFRLVADPGVLAFLNNIVAHSDYPYPLLDASALRTSYNHKEFDADPAAYMRFSGSGADSSTVFYKVPKQGSQADSSVDNLYAIASLAQ